MPTECMRCDAPLEKPGFLCEPCRKLQGSVHELSAHVDRLMEGSDNNVSDANEEEDEDET